MRPMLCRAKRKANRKRAKKMSILKLSKRQAEILEWVQKGASNKVIAKRLDIAESTVKVHVSDIFKRYGVKSRTQLAMSSTHGQQITIDLEPQPLVWVNSDSVTAISTKEIDGWTPLYKRTT